MTNTLPDARTDPGRVGDDEPWGVPTRTATTVDGAAAARLAGWPLIISASAHLAFFVVWWLPEFGHFPGHDALLGQLAPLVSKELTSQGQPVVATQADRSGWVAAALLLAAAALPFLVRARRWAPRVIGSLAVAYLGGLGLVITVLGLLTRGQLGTALLGTVGLAVWVATAGVSAWRALRVDPETVVAKPRRVFWLVVAFAVLNPGPLAVGRSLFAPELTAAARPLADTSPALRLAAMNTPATISLYLAGVSVALLLWSLYMLWPPIRPVRVPWIRRRPGERSPLVVRGLITLAAAIAVVLFAMAGSLSGAARAAQLLDGNPVADLPSSCTSWSVRRTGTPAQSLIAGGAACASLSSYRGYRLTAQHDVGLRLSSLQASIPEGPVIDTGVVGARYGGIVVLAGTTRFDRRPDELRAVRLADARPLWSFRCDDDQSFAVRFAGSSDGDAPNLGRATGRGEKTNVVVACRNVTYGLDARTGLPAR